LILAYNTKVRQRQSLDMTLRIL